VSRGEASKQKSEVLSSGEIRFLNSEQLGRLATATKDAVPQVTPVLYVMDKDNFVIATDYGTKKLENLRQNPKASIVVDTAEPNRGVMIVGDCEIYERGKEYLRLLKILFRKCEYYRKNPWGEGESPILVIKPQKHFSWGL
jgi:nitroimidazol reductase NimA-like FMN-containing flavoprotein (pyridoxamine 5'-phosphate oxidase superfamily)